MSLGFHFKIKGFEPAFGPDGRRGGQDQIKDETRVAKDRAERDR